MSKSNKKICIILLLIFMVFSFVGCQNNEYVGDTSTNEFSSDEDFNDDSNEGTDEDTTANTPENDDSPGLLSALHVPYIGRAPAVFRVVRALPFLGYDGWLWRSMVIDSDYRPYSLTLLYEPHEGRAEEVREQEKPIALLESSALLLFTLIDNLDEVKFAMWYTRDAASNYGDDYDYALTATRGEIAYLFGVDSWESLLVNNNFVEDILAMSPVTTSSS